MLTVRNGCSFAVKVTGAGGAGPVGVSRGLDELLPGAVGTVGLRFVPQDAGRFSERLLLRARAGPHVQDVAFVVEGEAVSPRRVTFETTAPAPVIQRSSLFVVDDRGAVERRPQVELLARYLETAYSQSVLGLELVVSDLTGQLQQPDGVTVLRTNEPSFRSRFIRAMEPPRAPGPRSCFDTAMRLKREGRPAGFWDRPWPPEIVCISTSLDDSSASGASMAGAFQGRDGQRQPFFVYLAPYSASGSCDGEVDLRLDALAASSGIRESLCSPNWDVVLQGSSGHLPRLMVWLPTTSVRSAASVQLEVEGTRLDPRFWRYQTTPPAIVMEPLYLPAPGDSLRITWDTCEP
jgi:hypothetical protein